MAETFLDRVSNKALGELLIEKGTLTEEQVQQALTLSQNTHIRLGEALIRLGFVSRDAIGYAIGEQYGMRPMELTPSMLDPMLIRRFPIPFLRRHNVLPLIQVQDEIVVVVSDPSQQDGLRELAEFVPGWTISAQLADANQIRRCLDTLGGREERPAASSIHMESAGEESEPQGIIPQILDAVVDSWPGQVRIRQVDGQFQVFRQDGATGLVPAFDLENEDRALFNGWIRREFHPMVFSHGSVFQYGDTVNRKGSQYAIRFFKMPNCTTPDFLLQALKVSGNESRTDLHHWLSQVPVQPGDVVAVQVPEFATLEECIHSFVTSHQAQHASIYLNQQLAIQPPHVPTFSAPYTDVCAACAGTAPTLVLFDQAPHLETLRCVQKATASQPALVFFTGPKATANAQAPQVQDPLFAFLTRPVVQFNHGQQPSTAETEF